MYSYGIYKNVRNASWQCLIDVGISELPVKVVRVASFYGIKVFRDSDMRVLSRDQYGISFVTPAGSWVIVYDDRSSLPRSRFTVAHELGHILLGHPLYDAHTRQYSESRPQVEIEADSFAARLLAPACVLWALDTETAEEIAELCGISYTAAKLRAARMTELKKRGMWLTHPLERILYTRFEQFIRTRKGMMV